MRSVRLTMSHWTQAFWSSSGTAKSNDEIAAGMFTLTVLAAFAGLVLSLFVQLHRHRQRQRRQSLPRSPRQRNEKARHAAKQSSSFAAAFSIELDDDDGGGAGGARKTHDGPGVLDDDEDDDEDDDDLYTSDEGENDAPASSQASPTMKQMPPPIPTAPRPVFNRVRGSLTRRANGSGGGGSAGVGAVAVGNAAAAHSSNPQSLVYITSRDPTSNLSSRPAQVRLSSPTKQALGSRKGSMHSTLAVRSSPRASPSPRSSPRLGNSAAASWGNRNNPAAATAAALNAATAPVPERNSSYHKAYDEKQKALDGDDGDDGGDPSSPRTARKTPPVPILRKQRQQFSKPGSDDSPSSSSSLLAPRPPIHSRSFSQPASTQSRSIQLTEPDWDLYVSFHIRARERQEKRRQFSQSSEVADATAGATAAIVDSGPLAGTDLADDWLHYSAFLAHGGGSDCDGDDVILKSDSSSTPLATSSDSQDFWYERFIPSTAGAGRNWDWRKKRAMQRRALALESAVRNGCESKESRSGDDGVDVAHVNDHTADIASERDTNGIASASASASPLASSTATSSSNGTDPVVPPQRKTSKSRSPPLSVRPVGQSRRQGLAPPSSIATPTASPPVLRSVSGPIPRRDSSNGNLSGSGSGTPPRHLPSPPRSVAARAAATDYGSLPKEGERRGVYRNGGRDRGARSARDGLVV